MELYEIEYTIRKKLEQYTHNGYLRYTRGIYFISKEDSIKEKEIKKKIEVQNTKSTKFSNKNFFRGK